MVVEKTSVVIRTRRNRNVRQSRRIVHYRYTPDAGDPLYNVRDVNHHLNQIREHLLSINVTGYLQVTVHAHSGSYLPSRRMTIGSQQIRLENEHVEYIEYLNQELNIFDDISLRGVRDFEVVVVSQPTVGGCKDPVFDRSNNCLWQCLQDRKVTGFKDVGQFRRFLHQPEGTPIPYTVFPKIEERCHCGLHLSGDVTYHPVREYNKNIYLKLVAGHYTVDQHDLFDKTESTTIHDNRPKIGLKERTVIVVDSFVDSPIHCCGKSGLFEVATRAHLVEGYDHYCQPILIKLKTIVDIYTHWRKKTDPDVKIEMDLSQAYDWIINQFDLVKEYTKYIGKKGNVKYLINMYKSGWIANTIRAYVEYGVKKAGYQIQPIEQWEYKWLDASDGSSFRLSQSGTYEDVYQYDSCGDFPSLLCSPSFNVPIKPGVLTPITQEHLDKYETQRYGLYHVEISGTPKRTFRFKSTNIYAHWDLTLAKKEGLSLKLLDDTFLYYSANNSHKNTSLSKLVCGSQLFGEYFKRLLKLKKDHKDCPLFKSLTSDVHGALIEKRHCNKYLVQRQWDEDSHQYVYPVEFESDEEDIDDFVQVSHDVLKIKTINLKQIYMSNLARIRPFIYAAERKKMYNKVIEPYYPRIIRWMTDGGLIKGKVGDFSHNPRELGLINEEAHYRRVIIRSINDWDGEF